MAKRTVCNLCGKTVDERVMDCDFSIHTSLGYGSKYDGDWLDIDLCPECADKVIDALQDKCKIQIRTPLFPETNVEA